jgi:hypothetical protein
VPVRPEEVTSLKEQGLPIERLTGDLERVIGGASKSSVRTYPFYLPARYGVTIAIEDIMVMNGNTPDDPVSCSYLSGEGQAQPTLTKEQWNSLRDIYMSRLVEFGIDQSLVVKELGNLSAPDNYEGTYCTIYHLVRPRICSTTQCNYSDTLIPRVLRNDPEKGVKLVRDMLLEPSLADRLKLVDNMVRDNHRRK